MWAMRGVHNAAITASTLMFLDTSAEFFDAFQ